MDIYKQLSSKDDDNDSSFHSLKTSIELNGLSTVDLLTYSLNNNLGVSQLSKKVGRSIREVENYLNHLSQEFYNSLEQNSIRRRPLNNGDKEQGQEVSSLIKTGLPMLDKQLHGGVPLGEITEIIGASGTGKSHFLLQLSLQSQLCGLPEENQCIYISTESPLETRRLEDMIRAYDQEDMSMDNILSIYCQDLESQDHILYTQLPVKLAQGSRNIRTVIIDSIAHHLRREDSITNETYLLNRIREQEEEFEGDNLYKEVKQRHETLMKTFFKSDVKYENRILKLQYLMLLHRHLLRLANKYNIAIVLSNQVSDHTTNRFDISSADDGTQLLDLDIQLGHFSGWDNITTYKYQQSLGENEVFVDYKNPELIHSELIKSLYPTRAIKRQRLDPNIEFDPRYTKSKVFQDQEYLNQKTLLSELHRSTNVETRKYVPALGHQWSRKMVSRIIMMKTYKPIIKEKDEIYSQSSQSIDPETGLTYSQLCEGFNLDEVNLSKRKYDQKFSKHSSVESLVKKWQVERYIKVISSPFDTTGCNNNNKIQFNITKNGIEPV